MIVLSPLSLSVKICHLKQMLWGMKEEGAKLRQEKRGEEGTVATRAEVARRRHSA